MNKAALIKNLTILAALLNESSGESERRLLKTVIDAKAFIEQVPEDGSRVTWLDDIAKDAMNGMLAHSTRYKPREGARSINWHEALSEEAYDIAEAMLRERDLRYTRYEANSKKD